MVDYRLDSDGEDDALVTNFGDYDDDISMNEDVAVAEDVVHE